MKLVAAKCPNCGANIDVDKNSDKTVCEYCGSNIIVEDAIAKFKLEVSGEVEVSNLTNFDKLFKLANRDFANKYYKDALEKYKRAIELDPDNPIIILKIGLCECLTSSFSNLNIVKLRNAFVDSYNLVKNIEDSRGIINSFIKQTIEAVDLLVDNISAYKKSNTLSSRDCEQIISKYNECVMTYEVCYESVQEDDELLDTIYSKIISSITVLRSTNRYISAGKSHVYKINANLQNQLNQKVSKYISEYNNRHPQPVNNSISTKTNNVIKPKISNSIDNMSVPSKIALFVIIGIVWLFIMSAVLVAIFGKYYYEGIWINGSEKIEIHDYDVTYSIDNKEIYSGEYKRTYEDGAYIISFDNYTFKTNENNNKMYFCKIKSKDDIKCLDYYENKDLEDVKIVKEEVLD